MNITSIVISKINAMKHFKFVCSVEVKERVGV